MKDGKNQFPHPMEPEDAALDRLLGRARPPAVSPYFSRRVLREVAALEENRGLAAAWTQRWQRWLDAMPRLPRFAYSGGALVLAAVGAVSLALLPHARLAAPRQSEQMPLAALAAPAGPTADAAEEVTPQDVDVIADLDNLMALEENRLWTEDSNSL